MATLNICKNCNKKFHPRQKINGEYRNLYQRRYCLVCIPFGSGTKSPHTNKIKLCLRCGRKYKYIHQKGFRLNHCNTCSTVIKYHKRKQESVDYKGGKCLICGYKKCLRSLCFHHPDPTKKEFTIGYFRSKNWEAVKKELDKCVLLCSNCHGEAHVGLIDWGKYEGSNST